MDRNEILKEIREITSKAMEYARTHADEIKNREFVTAQNFTTKTNSGDKLSRIILDAKMAAKNSYRVYESFKNRVAEAAETASQYEATMRTIAKILHI